MKARFDGRCGLCQGSIREGDDIVEVEGEWVHESCADDADDEAA